MLGAKVDEGLETGGGSQLLEWALGYKAVPWNPIKSSKIWAQRVEWLHQPEHLPGDCGTTVLRSATLHKQASETQACTPCPEPPRIPTGQTSGQVTAGTFSEHLGN